jgi:hypothetical protein
VKDTEWELLNMQQLAALAKFENAVGDAIPEWTAAALGADVAEEVADLVIATLEAWRARRDAGAGAGEEVAE